MTARLLALPALLLVTGLLAACGGDDGEPVVSTAADGTVVAELETKAGDAWTVTLPEGATEAYDLYGNDGREPIQILSQDTVSYTVPVGEMFAVALPQWDGPFAWRALEDTASGSILKLVEQGVNPHDAELQGGPAGTHYYVYRAVAAGRGTLGYGLFSIGTDELQMTSGLDIEVS